MIKVTFDSEAWMEEVCKRKIAKDNDMKFTKMDVIKSIKNLKFNVKNLYYEVVVRFNDRQVEEKIKDQWSLKFCKYAFRIFPTNLTKKNRNLRFKYGLKLANLANNIYAANKHKVLLYTKK
ncbi:hypothetical protein RhiirA4_486544 [Rhizophagus irregularis]|uniref:Uncharacterized protein n=1 Tax=Rhizophagus irregularis TaxID=588596 RepID=A0A2I1HRJ2_9GLOM|nr:hypothetical protein RhiirA4_486544 [Rhizophagus irregularis]